MKTKRWYIVGFKNNKRIDLDVAETLSQATKLLMEYNLAYAGSMTIDIILK